MTAKESEKDNPICDCWRGDDDPCPVHQPRKTASPPTGQVEPSKPNHELAWEVFLKMGQAETDRRAVAEITSALIKKDTQARGLVEALAFYADHSRWSDSQMNGYTLSDSQLNSDGQKGWVKAQAALQTYKGGKS